MKFKVGDKIIPTYKIPEGVTNLVATIEGWQIGDSGSFYLVRSRVDDKSAYLNDIGDLEKYNRLANEAEILLYA